MSNEPLHQHAPSCLCAAVNSEALQVNSMKVSTWVQRLCTLQLQRSWRGETELIYQHLDLAE